MGRRGGIEMTGPEEKSPGERSRRVLLADRDPRSLLASFLALITEPLDIILIDPGTPELEIRRVIDKLEPDRIQLTEDRAPEGWTAPVNRAALWALV